MTSSSNNLSSLIHEQRLKLFLSSLIKDGPLGIALFDQGGQSIIHTVSTLIPSQDFLKIISEPKQKEWVDQVVSSASETKVLKNPDHPVYLGSLTCNHSVSGAVMVWFAQEESQKASRREFSMIRQHLEDIIEYRYELDNLSSEIVRNYEELALLYDLSVRLGSQPDFDTICQVVVDQVHSILPGSNVALLLVNPETGEVSSQLAINGEGQALPPVHLGTKKGITGEVISSGQSVIVCDVHEHPSHVKVSYRIDSLMSVAMTMGDKVIGVINVSDKTNREEFTTYNLKLVSAISAVAAVSLENARHFGEVKDLYFSAVKSLVMAIDAKDPYTHSHSIRVSHLSATVAEILEFPPREVEDIRLAALLHDVGKIGIPEKVLLKEGKLTKEEWETMKQHPLLSVQILEHFKPFRHISKWVRCEHERHDGKGYPDGLVGEDIPVQSRIIAAADAFDAITSDRYYRKHRSDAVAIEILQEHSGTQFDPKIIEGFVEAYRQGKLKSSTNL